MIGYGILANLDIVPTKYLAFFSFLLTFLLILGTSLYYSEISLFELIGGFQ